MEVKDQYTLDEYLAGLNANGGSRVKTAEVMKIGYRHLIKQIKLLKERGDDVPPSPYLIDRTGYLQERIKPLHDAAPEGYTTKGVSSYHDGETGDVKGFWLKTDVDKARQLELMKAAIAELCSEIPAQAPIAAPGLTTQNLCNLVTFTDYHMGMLAWHREGGADWDLSIAKRVLLGSFEAMLAGAPNARVGFLAQLGDFLHTDGLSPVTPTSQHVLDADSRFQKIVSTTISVLRQIVNRMLQKFEIVYVLMAEGNHDMSSSIWLQNMFSALYEHEPRVVVVNSPLPYYAYQFGKTMLGFHHGHLSKMDKLPQLFAAQFREMWGATTRCYIHTGHLHHTHEKEHPGAVVTQHQTLAARDAYAARGGWYSERGAQLITYHAEFGEVGRTIVRPEMIQ